MNRQQIFDTVVSKLLIQGQNSVDEVVCRYRGPEGRKCAIGHLIPDELYNPDFETRSIDMILEDEKLSKNLPSWMFEEKDFLYRLQAMHDDEISEDLVGEEFRTELLAAAEEVAASHNLEWKYE